MFQSKQYLEKHTGRYGSERASYLQMLVTEFQDTANDGNKKRDESERRKIRRKGTMKERKKGEGRTNKRAYCNL